MGERVMRHGCFLSGVVLFVALLVLLPDIDGWRRLVGGLLLILCAALFGEGRAARARARAGAAGDTE